MKLTDYSRNAIRAELDEQPRAFLANTLRALRASDSRVEQESVLALRVPERISSTLLEPARVPPNISRPRAE